MTLSAGTKLGPYEIQSLLGAGGMGEVYRARDMRLGRDVAIKVLPAHLCSDSDLKQRMEREAKAISSLNHPHICTLHDVGSQDGIDFLVMEHLEGETLAERLQRGALPVEEALKIATEIAAALDRAHRRGIVHRDLKPANIMLTKNGPKLMDFGLAKPSPGMSGGSGESFDAEHANDDRGRIERRGFAVDAEGHRGRNVSIHGAGGFAGSRGRCVLRCFQFWLCAL